MLTEPSRALVVGASGGIGTALCDALATRGAEVATLSRRVDGLDVTDEGSVVAALDALAHPFDLILVVTGALTSTRKRPEKALSEFGGDEFLAQMRLNALGPMLVVKHLKERLPRRGRSVIALLSARVGSIADNRMGGWYSYRASKAALNALVHGAAIEVGRARKEAILVCLHPGTVATAFTRSYPGHDKVDADSAANRLLDVIAGLGPGDSGRFLDYAGAEIPW